jgi:hypothetical protein
MDQPTINQVITLAQYQKVKDERLKLVQDLTTKFINERILHPKDDAWLDNVHLWAGNNDEMQFYRVEYGIYLDSSCVVRSPTVFYQLSKAIEPFGYNFRGWGIRGGHLYLCFEETTFAVQNPKFVNEFDEAYKKIKGAVEE